MEKKFSADGQAFQFVAMRFPSGLVFMPAARKLRSAARRPRIGSRYRYRRFCVENLLIVNKNIILSYWY
ncbi:hypothetical protein JHJ32_01385 [Parapedobacter sp. ISTM3]|uniref:hypothetical protein n=1 Tax=Parapedobacter TaxID=416949 RepID=UPI00111647A8|nr:MULTISPECIES: hypothetical protein [Parapedobacter]MBK1438628.1 hypothetical protein [Parapedobacter sp. ISTM3]